MSKTKREAAAAYRRVARELSRLHSAEADHISRKDNNQVFDLAWWLRERVAKRIASGYENTDYTTFTQAAVEKAREESAAALASATARVADLERENAAATAELSELRRGHDEWVAAVRERDALRKGAHLLTHKVITCGVAAAHPDAELSKRAADYGGPWDSPQAQAVRALRAERDALRERVADLQGAAGCPQCDDVAQARNERDALRAQLQEAQGRLDTTQRIVGDVIRALPGYGDSPDGVAAFVAGVVAERDKAKAAAEAADAGAAALRSLLERIARNMQPTVWLNSEPVADLCRRALASTDAGTATLARLARAERIEGAAKRLLDSIHPDADEAAGFALDEDARDALAAALEDRHE